MRLIAAIAGVFALGCGLVLAGCSQGSSGGSAALPVSHPSATPSPTPSPPPVHASAADRIKHVIVIIQENRTVDNLFNGFCVPVGGCADTVTVDPVTGIPLQELSLAAPFGLDHSRGAFVRQYDDGKMDGFTQTPPLCHQSSCPFSTFAYVPAHETRLYRKLATVDGLLSDATFETEQGPSFPSHLYAIAGQSGGYDRDREAITGGSGNCGNIKQVTQIDMTTPYPGKFGPDGPSCKDFKTIFDLLAAKGLTWRYYSNAESSFFSGTQSVRHLFDSPHFIVGSERFLSDVRRHDMADVSFVMPASYAVSDHPDNVKDPQAGPRWVTSLVDAVGGSPYWRDAAIVVFWDDWGGFYDHVHPPQSPVDPDPFEYGFRVPLIVSSPYARLGAIDHTPRTFVSALRLIEEAFTLPSLGTTDRYEPDGLDSMFDFDQKPIPYTPLGSMNSPARRSMRP